MLTERSRTAEEPRAGEGQVGVKDRLPAGGFESGPLCPSSAGDTGERLSLLRPRLYLEAEITCLRTELRHYRTVELASLRPDIPVGG